MIHMKIKKNSTFQVAYGNIWKYMEIFYLEL